MKTVETFLVAACLIVAACSGSEDKTQPDTGEDAQQTDIAAAEDSAVADAFNTPDGDFTTSNLSGTWAQLQVVGTVADAPVLGEVKTISSAVLRWEISQDEGGSLVVSQVACDLSLKSDNELTSMVIPDAFVASIQPYEKPGTLDTTVDPPVLNVPTFPEVHGAVLDDPMNDPIPTDPEDPRLLDGDNDGHPGLTVYVTGIIDGAMYVVQRNMATIADVEVLAADRVEGLLGWSQEQVVLGSDNEVLAENPPETDVDPDPEKSYFIMVRIPADWTCEDILGEQETLF